MELPNNMKLAMRAVWFRLLFVFLKAVIETIRLNPLSMSPSQSLSLAHCAFSFSFLTWIKILRRD